MALRVAVVGAGSVGCYLGGALQRSGALVRFHGRAPLGGELSQFGLTLTDYRGLRHYIAPVALDYRQTLAALDEVNIILITVKAAATESVARELAGGLAPATTVISIQNGIGNADILRHLLPEQRVLAGCQSFNVLQRGQGRFHAGTDGQLIMEDDPVTRELKPLFAPAGIRVETSTNMPGVLWSKLLLNLNNSLNALSNQPLRQQLAQRDHRRCLALLQAEALAALARSEVTLPRLGRVQPRHLPLLLALPDALFRLLAKRMLAMDPLARSSMWEDLQRGRPTEVDALNGEVVKLAERLGLSAPANRRVVELIRSAEAGNRRHYSGAELLGVLGQAPQTAGLGQG